MKSLVPILLTCLIAAHAENISRAASFSVPASATISNKTHAVSPSLLSANKMKAGSIGVNKPTRACYFVWVAVPVFYGSIPIAMTVKSATVCFQSPIVFSLVSGGESPQYQPSLQKVTVDKGQQQITLNFEGEIAQPTEVVFAEDCIVAPESGWDSESGISKAVIRKGHYLIEGKTGKLAAIIE